MPIFSIGHGTRPINELLDLLKKYDIAWLADVRTIPYSKFNPQYNRESLHHSLKNADIHYVYLGDSLGGLPMDPSCHNIRHSFPSFPAPKRHLNISGNTYHE